MIVNEIAKFENAAPRALEILLVAELCEPSRSSSAVRFDWLLSGGHPLPLRRKGLLLRPSGARAYAAAAAARQVRKGAGPRARARCRAGARPSSRIARSPGRGARGTATSAGVLGVGPREHLGRVGDVVDQVGHRRLRLGHRRHERGAAGRLGEPDVEAHVGLPVGREVARAGRPSRRRARPAARARRGARALGGEHRDAELDRQPRVARVAPAREHLGASGARGPAARRPRTCRRRGRAPRRRWPLCTSAVSAWRSVERAMPSCSHSSRSAGSRVPGASRPSLIALPRRSSVSSNAVCDRTGAKTLCERRRRSQPLEPPDALPVGHRRLERVELDPGVVEVVVDDLLAERRRARPRCAANRSCASRSVRGHARLVGRVGVALDGAARAPARRRCRAGRRRSSRRAPGTG